MPPPLSLRFHPGLKHPTGESWPTMVALIIRGRDDEPIGVHRTILARDGRGKAPVTPQKMMLGRCRGGAVRLADAGDQLMVSEGIENALAVMQVTSKPAWAALSTSGLMNLDLPVATTDITILADGDDAVKRLPPRHLSVGRLRGAMCGSQGRRLVSTSTTCWRAISR